MTDDNFIIASHKPWNKDLAKDLSSETNKNFNLLSNHKDLNLSYLERIKPKIYFFLLIGLILFLKKFFLIMSVLYFI